MRRKCKKGEDGSIKVKNSMKKEKRIKRRQKMGSKDGKRQERNIINREREKRKKIRKGENRKGGNKR